MPAVHNGPDTLQVHVPTPLGYVVGVADLVAKARSFAANFTYSCHLSRFSNLSTKYSKQRNEVEGPPKGTRHCQRCFNGAATNEAEGAP